MGQTTMGQTLIKAEEFSAGYGRTPLFSAADFELMAGECVFLCGANGSGKSTLMKTLAGLLPPVTGRVLRPTGARVAMIPTGIPKVKGFTLREFVMTGCFSRSDWSGRLSPEAENDADAALESLGIAGLGDRDLTRLSDGEFQKACTASALAGKAGVLLLDEPTAYLDAENRISVLGTLKKVARETETAIMFSSHDLSESASVCDRVFAIGADGMFRCGSGDGDEKNKVISSIFRNKNIIFEG